MNYKIEKLDDLSEEGFSQYIVKYLKTIKDIEGNYFTVIDHTDIINKEYMNNRKLYLQNEINEIDIILSDIESYQ